MTWWVSVLFRVLLWGLLTGDGSSANLLIGAVVALLLPQRQHRGDLRSLLKALAGCLIAIPVAYGEAIRLMLSPADREEWLESPSNEARTAAVIFLDVFAITLTPFTIVLGVSAGANGPTYRIHRLSPAGRRKINPGQTP